MRLPWRRTTLSGRQPQCMMHDVRLGQRRRFLRPDAAGENATGGGIRMPSLTERIKVGNQDMALYVTVPSGTGPFPAIVVIQHGGGVDTFVRTMVDRLATAGYAAVAPDLYHRLGPGVERPIP